MIGDLGRLWITAAIIRYVEEAGKVVELVRAICSKVRTFIFIFACMSGD